MKCFECNLWWTDEGNEYPSCHADPNWKAPCEYEDEDESVVDEDYDPGLEPDWEMLEYSDEPSFPEGELRIGKKWNCTECTHNGQETTDDVACCNCCENGEFFKEREENE